MEGKADQAKGRVKQAAGDLTDNDRLKREGKNDETVGKVKDKMQDAENKGEEMVDNAKDATRRE
jgi:uncharacterized protein YjbJ (UPF0337 family)